jgi:hypothetical protein
MYFIIIIIIIIIIQWLSSPCRTYPSSYESESRCDRRSVGQSVLVSSPI